MKSEHYNELLASHDIKPTANRLLVVRALDEAVRPLSLLELETQLETLDKSSIFRVLTLLRDSHLVHVIEEGNGVRYELCQSHHHDTDDDIHPHFHCERCRRTFCLSHTQVPHIDLPEGFVMTSVNYLVKGLCPDCARHEYVLPHPETYLA